MSGTQKEPFKIDLNRELGTFSASGVIVFENICKLVSSQRNGIYNSIDGFKDGDKYPEVWDGRILYQFLEPNIEEESVFFKTLELSRVGKDSVYKKLPSRPIGYEAAQIIFCASAHVKGVTPEMHLINFLRSRNGKSYRLFGMREAYCTGITNHINTLLDSSSIDRSQIVSATNSQGLLIDHMGLLGESEIGEYIPHHTSNDEMNVTYYQEFIHSMLGYQIVNGIDGVREKLPLKVEHIYQTFEKSDLQNSTSCRHKIFYELCNLTISLCEKRHIEDALTAARKVREAYRQLAFNSPFPKARLAKTLLTVDTTSCSFQFSHETIEAIRACVDEYEEYYIKDPMRYGADLTTNLINEFIAESYYWDWREAFAALYRAIVITTKLINEDPTVAKYYFIENCPFCTNGQSYFHLKSACEFSVNIFEELHSANEEEYQTQFIYCLIFCFKITLHAPFIFQIIDIYKQSNSRSKNSWWWLVPEIVESMLVVAKANGEANTMDSLKSALFEIDTLGYIDLNQF